MMQMGELSIVKPLATGEIRHAFVDLSKPGSPFDSADRREKICLGDRELPLCSDPAEEAWLLQKHN
jgi:hypothetical protein